MMMAVTPLDLLAVLVALGVIVGMGAVTFRALALLGMMAGIRGKWRKRGYLLLLWAVSYLLLTMVLDGPGLWGNLTTDNPPNSWAVALEGVRAAWLWTLYTILPMLAKGRLGQ